MLRFHLHRVLVGVLLCGLTESMGRGKAVAHGLNRELQHGVDPSEGLGHRLSGHAGQSGEGMTQKHLVPGSPAPAVAWRLDAARGVAPPIPTGLICPEPPCPEDWNVTLTPQSGPNHNSQQSPAVITISGDALQRVPNYPREPTLQKAS
jgi:hypothetical protein